MPPTPVATLRRARDQAKAAGLKHVYLGNIRDVEGQSSYCTGCGKEVIGRDGYEITAWNLDAQGHCPDCGKVLAGHFAPKPGHWGMKRRPVVLSDKSMIRFRG